MDKAIKCLEKFGKVSRASIKLSSEIEDAISELQAHKAKIEELKVYCKKQMEYFESRSRYLFNEQITIYDGILQKLEELDK